MSKAGGNKGGSRTGGRGGAGSSNLHVRVKKKAGTIKESSRRWLERHLNDPYVHKSRQDGYRSRAAYKLIEINDRYNLLKKGRRSSTSAPPRRLVTDRGQDCRLDR